MVEERYIVKKWYDENAIYDNDELFAIVDVRNQANTIADRLNEQDICINDLLLRIETLEKGLKLSSYEVKDWLNTPTDSLFSVGDILDLKIANEIIDSQRNEIKELTEKNKSLKDENMEYYKLINCSNCKYHNYDWYDDGDEFEVCDKGNTERLIYNQFCMDYEKD